MTAQDYDSQLLESVSVRRRRLRDALLFGAQRQRRSLDERMGKVFAGVESFGDRQSYGAEPGDPGR